MRTQDQLHTPVLQARYTEAWFEMLFQALDGLHDAVSLGTALPVVPAEMVGWLEDIIYTANETIHEIRANYPQDDMTAAEESAS